MERLDYRRGDILCINSDGISVGDKFYIGRHQWRVLEICQGKMLLISELSLHIRAFDGDGGKDYTHSEIFIWLSGRCPEWAFPLDFLPLILKTETEKSQNPQWGTQENSPAAAYMFLLSVQDAEKYFTDDSDRKTKDTFNCDEYWWLRTPGKTNDRTAFVGVNGDILYGGWEQWRNCGFRPAVWVKTDMEINLNEILAARDKSCMDSPHKMPFEGMDEKDIETTQCGRFYACTPMPSDQGALYRWCAEDGKTTLYVECRDGKVTEVETLYVSKWKKDGTPKFLGVKYTDFLT